MNIDSIVVKRFKPYRSNGEIIERKNLFSKNFSTKTINEKWIVDITYIYTMKEVWFYLTSVMDLPTRKIIGYAFSKVMNTNETYTDQLKNII